MCRPSRKKRLRGWIEGWKKEEPSLSPKAQGGGKWAGLMAVFISNLWNRRRTASQVLPHLVDDDARKDRHVLIQSTTKQKGVVVVYKKIDN